MQIETGEIKHNGKTYSVERNTDETEPYYAIWRGYGAYGMSPIQAVRACEKMINEDDAD
jgi:hypothetical protein